MKMRKFSRETGVEIFLEYKGYSMLVHMDRGESRASQADKIWYARRMLRHLVDLL